MGSPPLTRERLYWHLYEKFSERITPAYAGKTINPVVQNSSTEDHPRLRGKDTCSLLTLLQKIGSPPLTRERLHQLHFLLHSLKDHPRLRGKDPFLTFGPALLRDHPRLRGKDEDGKKFESLTEGSPPLTRERRTIAKHERTVIGITPAYAGKT